MLGHPTPNFNAFLITLQFSIVLTLMAEPPNVVIFQILDLDFCPALFAYREYRLGFFSVNKLPIIVAALSAGKL